MKKIYILLIVSVCLLPACEVLETLSKLQKASTSNNLTNEKIIAGLKEALNISTKNATQQLSSNEAFSKESIYRIQIPEKLQNVTDTMKKIGLGFMVDDFENKMNDAAREASAYASPVFINAIKKMSFNDARKILYSSDSAATDYFKRNTYNELNTLYRPIIKKNMEKLGVIKMYNELMDKYDAIPFKDKPKFSLDSYITEQALNAMFLKLSEEEKKIRNNPSARCTKLLKEVFGK